jgi:hypothetical protein
MTKPTTTDGKANKVFKKTNRTLRPLNLATPDTAPMGKPSKQAKTHDTALIDKERATIAINVASPTRSKSQAVVKLSKNGDIGTIQVKIANPCILRTAQ